MATNTFAAELREGFMRIAGCFSEEELALIRRARDPILTHTVERNRLLTQVLCAYRRGPKERWGPVVVDLLAPGLVLMLPGLRPLPPVIDEDEIRQQLVVEALRAAATVPLLDSGRQTRFRITSRVYTNMLRWLGKEGRRRRAQVSLEDPRSQGR